MCCPVWSLLLQDIHRFGYTQFIKSRLLSSSHLFVYVLPPPPWGSVCVCDEVGENNFNKIILLINFIMIVRRCLVFHQKTKIMGCHFLRGKKEKSISLRFWQVSKYSNLSKLKNRKHFRIYKLETRVSFLFLMISGTSAVLVNIPQNFTSQNILTVVVCFLNYQSALPRQSKNKWFTSNILKTVLSFMPQPDKLKQTI